MPRVLQKLLRRVCGKPAWLVRKGYGSLVKFEFGKPRLKIGKNVLKPKRKAGRKYPPRPAYVHGAWTLTIYCCRREIRQIRQKLCHSESSDKRMERACGVLNGQILTGVTVKPGCFETEFHFDLGGLLRTRPYKGESMEMWYLRCPTGRYLGLRSDGTYCYCPGDTKPEEIHWRRLAP